MSSYPRVGAGTRIVKSGPASFSKVNKKVPPPPSAKAVMLETKRRMEKAERDERVDITKALTEVKTYMGGFTRPQDLRASNWFPGGPYVEKGKIYESPPPAAYEPHTVFLLQARHYTKHGVGRADSLEHVVGVCREGDLPLILAKYNSDACPKDEMEIMDNAQWPWLPSKGPKRVVWWDKNETKQDALALRQKEIMEDDEFVFVPMDLPTTSLPPSGLSVQRRAYHSSSRASAPASSETPHTSTEERRQIPASSWSRPHKPSQDAEDDVVPVYYVERKRQRDDIEQRKEAEGNLMAQLGAGILSEGIAAQTRVRENKIPVEVIEEDGTIRHPSGFEPPTPATDFHPVAAKEPVEDDTPVITPANVSWDHILEPVDASPTASSATPSAPSGARGFHTSAVSRAAGLPRSSAKERRKIPASAWSRPHKPSQDAHDDVVPAYYIERKRQRDDIEQRKEAEGNLMAQLSAGILSEGIAAQTRVRENKVPVEVVEEDGTVRLPSGFQPPTPATDFHPVAAMTPAEDGTPVLTPGISWHEALEPVDASPSASASSMSSGPSGARGFHTSAASRASGVPRTSAKERRKIPASAWARPHKPSQDADDNVVPAYYIERKRQRDDIEQRKEAEGSLMAQLSAGILSEGIAAQTRVRENKVPVEVVEEDGTVRLPSGFEPPTPATDFHPVAALPPAEDGTPVVSQVSWHEALESVDASASATTSSMSSGPSGTRGYHTSAVTRATGIPPSTSSQRRKIPASAWSRPHKPSQDAHDDVVPAYYVERKRQRDDIEQRKEAEGSLMAQLSAGILSEGIAAQTRVRENKIPVEVVEEDGTVRLASGFEPPTPATDFHPSAAMSSAKDDPTSGKMSWDEALAPSDALAASSSSLSAVSGTRGFHTSAVARAREHPMDLLGVDAPAPPSPVTQIKQQTKVKAQQEEEEDLMEEEDEYYDEDDVESFSSAVSPITSSAREFKGNLAEHRARYMATLAEQPFWRPVLTATFSTRPLAVTYARLSRALPRGLAYYAAIDNHDRKYGPVFSSRVNSLRVRRMRQLAFDIARRLRGDFGGFPGIRFSTEGMGRGINGEGLADPIPADKRMIQIGVGEWHPFGRELKTLIDEEAQDADLATDIKTFGLDEYGRRSDGEEWRAPVTPLPSKSVYQPVAQELKDASPAERKRLVESIAEGQGRELAFAASQRSRSVEYPFQGKAVPVEKFLEAYKPPPAVVPKAQWRP